MHLRFLLLICLLIHFVGRAQTLTTTTAFYHTGTTQTFVVPSCVNQMSVTLKGAQGGASGSASGGEGGQLSAVIHVTPGTVFYINVGGQGSLTAGGFNGGASGGNGSSGNGAGGGGATDIRVGANVFANRILVTGGGGGGAPGPNFISAGGRAGFGSFCLSPLGFGGNGGIGISNGGTGGCAPGTATAFGTGGAGAGLSGGGLISGDGNGGNGAAGGLGLGGAGGSGGVYGAGGGGGGYYGGAGGMSANTNTAGPNGSGGGGGGSSWIDGNLLIGNPFFNSYNYGHGVAWFIYQLIGTLQVNATSTAVCTGGSVGLSAGGLSTYTWHPNGNFLGSNATSVVVSPTVTSNYSITGHNAAGCPFGGAVQIQLQTTTPGFSVLVAPSASVCPGATMAMLAYGGPSVAFAPAYMNGTTFTPLASQVYTLQSSNSCGTTTSLVPITVSQLPLQVQMTPTAFCSGAIVTLSASGAFNSYTWNPGNIVSNSIQVVANTNTLYSVTGTNTPPCITTTTILIQPSAQPTLTVISSSPFLCSGQSFTLNAFGAQSFTWSPGAITTASYTGLLNAGQNFTLFGLNNPSCSAQTTFSMPVYPYPLLNVQVSPLQICAMDAFTLAASGAQNYFWSPGGNQTAVYSGTLNASQNFTLLGSNAYCTSQTVVLVPVDPNPTLLTQSSASLICTGSTVGISATSNGSVTWNNGFAGYQQTLSPPTSTVYTLISQLGNCTSTAAIDVDVFQPSLSVSPSGTICAGQFFTLQAYSFTNSTYQWAPLSSQNHSLQVNPTSTTLYTVTAVNHSNNIMCPLSETIAVTINPLPVLTITASDTSICQAEGPVVIVVGGANTYTWNTLVNTASISVSPSITTVYSFTGTGINGCVQNSSFTLEVHECLILEEESGHQLFLEVYPNPSTEHCFIIKAKEGLNAYLYGAEGTLLKQFIIESDVKICDLLAGSYFLLVEKNNLRISKKIIVLR